MKRVVVTGAKGGTGRSIVKVLRAAGYDVVGVDIKPVCANDIGCVQADLVCDTGLHDLFAGAEAVVHFGSLPTDVWTSRSEAYRNLMLGGFNMLQACANLGIPRFVLASSIMVYGDFRRHRYFPIDEDSPLAPTDTYSSCKVLLEQLARDFCRWKPISIAALRLGRIVYEGCFDERLKRHTQSNESAADVLWTYVDARDVATACKLWIESDVTGFHAFNIAASDVCVETLTEELTRTNYPQVSETKSHVRGNETPFSSMKLRSMLSWEAKYDWKQLRDGS